MYPTTKRRLRLGALLIMSLWAAPMAQASSHMDAPLISLDDPANTTDVYAFKSRSGGVDYLTTALAVYPFEEPGIGPNNYRFDPAVDYEIHVALGNHVGSGLADLSYRFEFSTTYANRNTILQAYIGVVEPGAQFSPNQNLRQTYKVTRFDHRNGTRTVLGDNLMVPPNNQGRVTPLYNKGNDGDNPATRSRVCLAATGCSPASATTAFTPTSSRSSISTSPSTSLGLSTARADSTSIPSS